MMSSSLTLSLMTSRLAVTCGTLGEILPNERWVKRPHLCNQKVMQKRSHRTVRFEALGASMIGAKKIENV